MTAPLCERIRTMEYTTGSKLLDGWEIVRPIGAGSYGKVYEVKKTSYGVETVSALKVIRIPESPAEIRSALNDGMDEQSVTGYFKGFVDEILHEIAIMSAVKSHPSVVSYEDHHLEEYPGEIRWDILIRMELLKPLDQYLQEQNLVSGLPNGSLPTEEVVRLGMDIGSALAFCQRKNIIHRDIKPENIFISEAGQFKLGDFGVAKTAAARSTGGSHKGTERYMAPEVFLNQPYGPSVDIYSLGLVMYRLLNGGRLPFLPPAPKPISFGDYENAQIKRMQGVPIPPPSLADKPLADIVLKACAFRSSDRFRSAAELYAALDACAGRYKVFPGSPLTEPEVMTAGEPLPTPGETEPEGEAVGSMGDSPEAAAPQEGTVGGWNSPESTGMPQEGTVGGWGGSGEGTIGGRQDVADGNQTIGENTAPYCDNAGRNSAADGTKENVIRFSTIQAAERKQSTSVNWPLVLSALAAQIFCQSVFYFELERMVYGSVTDTVMFFRSMIANGVLAGLLGYICAYHSMKTAVWTLPGIVGGKLLAYYLGAARAMGFGFPNLIIMLLPYGACLAATVFAVKRIKSKRMLLCMVSGCYMAVYVLSSFM